MSRPSEDQIEKSIEYMRKELTGSYYPCALYLSNDSVPVIYGGVTIREMLAKDILCSLIQKHGDCVSAKAAVKYADQLIEELKVKR